MLPSYFDYIFVDLRQKARLRPELSPKCLSTLGPNPARTRPAKARPDLQLWLQCTHKQTQGTICEPRGQGGEGFVFMTSLIASAGFNLQPGYVVMFLDKMLYDYYDCLVASTCSTFNGQKFKTMYRNNGSLETFHQEWICLPFSLRI